MYHCGGCTCIYREDEGGGDEHGDDGAESGGELVQLRWVYAQWYTCAMVQASSTMSTADQLLHAELEERVCFEEYHAVHCEWLMEQIGHVFIDG